MPEQMFWRFQSLPLALHDGFAEVDRVPVNDNGRPLCRFTQKQ